MQVTENGVEYMNDREFWIAIRAALLGIVDAIERKWSIGKYSKK